MINHPTEKLISDAVNRYSDTVFRIAFQYVGNSADAEDVVQEVFLTLLKKPPSLTGDDGCLKAWLIRVTVNKSKDLLRANKRRRNAVKGFEPPLHTDCFNEVFETLSYLPELDRTVLYLHYYEGYTAREIAQILGGNERAITKRIARARDKLKNFLEE